MIDAARFRTPLGALLALGALFSVACSVAPPTPLAEDPAHRDLALARPVSASLVLAPVTRRGVDPWRLEVAPLGSSTTASLTSSSEGVAALESASGDASLAAVSSEDEALAPLGAQPAPEVPRRFSVAREYASEEAVSLSDEALRARLGSALAWGLRGGEPLAPVEGAGPGAWLAEAQAAGATHIVHADLLGARAAWVERDGLWWWADLGLFWGFGVLPAVFIADEVYEVEVAARVSLVEASSGAVLTQETVRGVARRSLNHPQRGWSVGGLLWLHPYTLDADDLADVSEALLPHALKEWERNLLVWSREAFPAAISPAGPAGLAPIASAVPAAPVPACGGSGPESFPPAEGPDQPFALRESRDPEDVARLRTDPLGLALLLTEALVFDLPERFRAAWLTREEAVELLGPTLGPRWHDRAELERARSWLELRRPFRALDPAARVEVLGIDVPQVEVSFGETTLERVRQGRVRYRIGQREGEIPLAAFFRTPRGWKAFALLKAERQR